MTDKLFTKRLRDLTDEAIRESLAEISVEFEKRFGPAALTASPPVVGTTPGVNCPSCGHRLPAGYSGPCVACDAPNVLDLPGAPIVEREAIARDISRVAGCQVGSERTRKIVDYILALTPVEGVGELTRLRAALIEVGRNAGCLLADDVSTDFLMHVPEEVRLKLSTPVAQGDEVRDVLPDIETEGERVVAETHRHPSGMYLWTDVVGAVQTAIAEERERHVRVA